MGASLLALAKSIYYWAKYIKTDDVIASVKESHYKDKDMGFFLVVQLVQ